MRVAGRVERFRDELQIELRAIARADDADPAAFLPVAFRDLDELDGFLEHLAGEVRDPAFAALLADLLGDGALRAALRRTPCTRAGHHAYLGGLLEHTVAVATLALETCTLHPRLDQNLLLTAAIVHDLGKTREFTLGAEIGLTDEGRLLGHVELGLRMLDERAAAARRAPAARPRALRAHPPRRSAPARRPRRSRCSASTRSTPPSRARSSTGCRPALNEEAPVLGAPAPRRWAAEPGGLGTAGRSPVQSPPRQNGIATSRDPAPSGVRRTAIRLRPAVAGAGPGGYRSAATSAQPPGAAASASSTARSSVARVNGFCTKARLPARAPLRTTTSSVCPDM